MSDLLDTPWGIEVDKVRRQQGLSWVQAWEDVLEKWLRAGNIEPLAYLLAHGIVPTSKTLRYFAAMLGPNTKIHLVVVPYRICLHRRSQAHGRPRRPDRHATLVERLITVMS
jgi:hypothetical protein